MAEYMQIIGTDEDYADEVIRELHYGTGTRAAVACTPLIVPFEHSLEGKARPCG
jgi:hypothetical protein